MSNAKASASPTNAQLAVALRKLSLAAGKGDATRIVNLAADRLEVAGEPTPKFTILKVRQLSASGPALWDCTDEDDDEILITYSRGMLKVYMDSRCIEMIAPELPDKNRMTTAEMIATLVGSFNFPATVTPTLRRLSGRSGDAS